MVRSPRQDGARDACGAAPCGLRLVVRPRPGKSRPARDHNNSFFESMKYDFLVDLLKNS
jgi:hypothetical protein